MAGAGCTTSGEYPVARGTRGLRAAALRPATGTWVDTNTDLSTADLGNFTSGLEAASTTQSVVSDSALASTNDSSNFTSPSPSPSPSPTVPMSPPSPPRRRSIRGFSADPDNPVLAANQLLAGLSFVHFEDEFEMDPRGVVSCPPLDGAPNRPSSPRS